MPNNVRCPEILRKCRQCKRRNTEKAEACPECGADLHCTKYCVPGYNRCESHGGPVVRRDFYGTGYMKHGENSSFPITRLAAKYNAMQKDGRVLSNRQAIDVVDTRIMQLLERVDVNEAPDRIQKLYELWQEYNECERSGRSADALAVRRKIDDEFEKVYHDYAAWKQMFDALDLRRKMVESEVKVLTQIRAIITAEDAYEMNAKMLAAVMRVVGDDPKKMKQVQYEFARLVGDVSDTVAERLDSDDERDDPEGGGEE